jgi:transcriptional regulator with XRE-family HTH domain
MKEGAQYMSTVSSLWKKLAKSKKYREEFVAAQVKRGIPFQARALLKSREGWTQEILAERSGLTQGVVSRALNPNYGNLTLNTIIRIAAGFDVAFIGRFVPFSELENWFENMSEETAQVLAFEEEDEAKHQSKTVVAGVRANSQSSVIITGSAGTAAVAAQGQQERQAEDELLGTLSAANPRVPAAAAILSRPQAGT